MTGALQHIKDDRYRAIVYVGLDREGKQVQRSRSFRAKNRQEALRLKDGIAADLRAEAEADREDPGTIGALVAAWLADNELTKSPTTMKGYRICARRIVTEFGRLRVDQLTAVTGPVFAAVLCGSGQRPECGAAAKAGGLLLLGAQQGHVESEHLNCMHQFAARPCPP